MRVYKKLLFVITVVVFFIQQSYSLANDIWQLYDCSKEMSDDEEIKLGRKVDECIKNLFQFYKDTELNKQVNDITQKLASSSNRKTLPYSCTIIESPSVNAFSAPGGYIYITDGLLKFTRNQDELAGIIGHEIAHASLRHISRLYRQIMEDFSHKDREANPDMNLLFNTHLQEFEQEADSVGVLYAHRAGFDPYGLPDFLERHLSFMMHNGIRGLLNLRSYGIINTRIDHLKKYILTLELKKEEIYESND